MNTNYFQDKNNEMDHIGRFLLSGVPTYMILHGEEGIGKSALLNETLKKYSRNTRFTIISKVIDDKPIAVNLLELAEITCAALGKTELYNSFYHALYEGTTHYLTHPLLGNTSAEARLIFEQGSNKKTSEIVDTFCNEFQKNLALHDDPILVLLDFQSDMLSSDCRYFIQSMINLIFLKHKFLIALRDIDFLVLKPDFHVLLPIQPFSLNEVEQQFANTFQYFDVPRVKLWKISEGNPLKYNLASIIAAKKPSLLDDVKELLPYASRIEDDICKKILLILSLFHLPIELDKLSSCLDIKTDSLKGKISSSNLLLLVESSERPTTCTVIHPSVYQNKTNIGKIGPVISKKLINWFLPELPFFDTYGYYAKHPRYLFARLDILESLNPESFVELITSASIRSLMRQWGAMEQANQYLLSASAICSKLGSNTIQKARIFRELAYNFKLMGQLGDFEQYSERFFREIETVGEVDSVPYVNTVLQTVEAIAEKANFARQEGNYGEAIDLLFEAQSKLDFLLELSPSNRKTTESELARIVHNLGIVYRDQALTDIAIVDMLLVKKSISCFEEALEIETLYGNLPGKISALSQLSVIYAMIEKDVSVNKYFNDLLVDATSIGEEIIVADTAGNIAAIYAESKYGNLWEQGLIFGKLAVRIYSQNKIQGPKRQAEKVMTQLFRKLGYGKEN